MAQDKIKPEEVQHVANLARLALNAEQLEAMSGQLNAILEYIASLDALDVRGVEPTVYPGLDQMKLREDVVKDTLARDEAFAQAPKTADGGFAVPKVMEG
ncbi:MAG: Asp-tRNA(Asn)/Glu-tRNA(Gln) amidotransferase subunit GatC [Myxococcales bacterium]|nr:MAG: Asp-tRNA(Asn)/Glu-tRNA(Gln) amidotransferase subunit GatC [Myxococcales bacterium]